jgi:Domain of unknown function (DUF932)
VVDALVERFGDGVSGQWRVPGEFGDRVTVTKENTTLYASDRDMFVFLADEENRIELPNRRAGRMGSFARGFFVGNSEVGKSSLFAGFFLFDYVCCNRIIWGADQYTEVRIRHTKGAPDRWLEEVTPVLQEYAEGSAKPVVQAIEDARSKRVDDDFVGIPRQALRQADGSGNRRHPRNRRRPADRDPLGRHRRRNRPCP